MQNREVKCPKGHIMRQARLSVVFGVFASFLALLLLQNCLSRTVPFGLVTVFQLDGLARCSC